MKFLPDATLQYGLEEMHVASARRLRDKVAAHRAKIAAQSAETIARQERLLAQAKAAARS